MDFFKCQCFLCIWPVLSKITRISQTDLTENKMILWVSCWSIKSEGCYCLYVYQLGHIKGAPTSIKALHTCRAWGCLPLCTGAMPRGCVSSGCMMLLISSGGYPVTLQIGDNLLWNTRYPWMVTSTVPAVKYAKVRILCPCWVAGKRALCSNSRTNIVGNFVLLDSCYHITLLSSGKSKTKNHLNTL